MKRILLALFVLVMLLSCACGAEGPDTDSVNTEAPVTDEISGDIPETEAESEKATDTDTETEAAAPETTPEETPAEPPFVKPEISAEQKTEYYGYLYSSWREKIQEIEAERGDDFTFLVQTDTHFYVDGGENTANTAKAFSHYVDLDFIACTGDLIRGYAYDEDNRADTYKCLEELTRRYTENANCPVLMTLGNHDTNVMWCREFGTANMQINQHDHYFMVTEKLKELNGANMKVDENKNHYYMDFPDFGVRVIMLNTTDGNYVDEFGDVSFISERQREWFRKEALDTELSVIVMSHIPLWTEFPENNAAPTGSKEILTAVENFIAEGGDFVAYMCGHVHKQESMVDKNGRLHISFLNGGANGEVVFVDTNDRTIRTVGVGKAASRSFTYGE